MKMHIEFIGLPGSGKSTLHREAVRRLALRRQKALGLPEAVAASLRRDASDKLVGGLVGRALLATQGEMAMRLFARSQDKFLGLAGFLADNPGLGEIVMASQTMRDIAFEHKRLVLKWMLDLFAAFHFVRERLSGEELLLLDEGFCNRVNTLFAYGPNTAIAESEVAAYIDQIPQPDLIFAIDTTTELCEARLDRRGWTERLGAMSAAERRDVLERCEVCIDLALTRLRDRGVEVRRVGNNDSLSVALAGLEYALSGAVRTAEVPPLG